MQMTTYEYPIVWEKVYFHRKANLIGKKSLEIDDQPQDYGSCEYCGRKIGYIPKFQYSIDFEERFSHYGPNAVLYFGITKTIIYFLFICVFLFGISALVLNVTGDNCQTDKRCLHLNIVYYWSIMNIINDEDKILGQLIIQLIICLTLIGFNLYLRVYTRRVYNRIDEENITQADFSIILRSLPEDTTQPEIEEVVQQMKQDISDDDFKKEKSRQMKIVKIIRISKTKKYFQAIEQNVQNLKKLIKSHKHEKFKAQKLPTLNQFSGSAIVVFDSAYSNNFIDYSVNCKDQIVSYFFPFFKPACKYKVRDKYINVEIAPEPSDIIWTHFGYTEKSKIWRKILFTAISLLALVVCAGINYLLEKERIKISKEDKTKAFWFKNLQTFILFLFNPIIQRILYHSTRKQKLDNKTDEKIQLMFKTSFYQTVNTGFFVLIIPYLAWLPDYQQGLRDIAASQNVLTIIVFQTGGLILVNLLFKVFELDLKVKKFLIKHEIIILTQTEANKEFEGKQMSFVYNYVYNLRIVWFSLVFGIISPICILFGAISLSIHYNFERYFVSQKYSIPQYGGPRLNSEFIDLLDGTPFLIGIFNLLTILATTRSFEYDKVNFTHSVLIFICIGIGFANFFMPWNLILEKLISGMYKDIDTPYKEASQNFEVTYELMNPASTNPSQMHKVDSRWIKKYSKAHRGTSDIQSSRPFISSKTNV